ncbi:hypothetical protein GCM10010495_44810 [Kitasatospora herbaricolor]|uniref:hypothetical protein n=1 Tax=Kitasatospora herbaricolor TaxID=68217 RepID=UPI00174E45D0|nr:hypothetical protein [Kitasatospora herbaricolor]MDQ0305972.1 hypothetical protein [Kitasatospora herbaricolor]GGV24127.1 hypothetical protein GCM10010495_44810 [Kitasatospora herbaricolor]
MTSKGKRPDAPATSGGPPTGPASFLAAAAALAAIDDAVRTARNTRPTTRSGTGAPDEGPEPALSALVLLRELRIDPAGWEAGLVERARDGGATWADLAHPPGPLRVLPFQGGAGAAAARAKRR